MPRQSLRGTPTHYQQTGRGSDLVLIHGLFSDLAFWWLHIAPQLAETHRVTALDLRGHGFSGLSPQGYRAIDFADDVVALMDHLGIQQTHLVGHSFGGAIAVAVAARHPSRVGRLTLVDAWIPSLQRLPVTTRSTWPDLQGRLRDHGIIIESELPRVAHGLIEELLGVAEPAGHPGLPPPQQASLQEASPLWTGQRGSGRALRRWRELAERTSAIRDVHDPAGLDPASIGRIVIPADLVYGARSMFLPSRDGLAAALVRSRQTMVPNAGHFFPILQPSAFLAAFGQGAAGACGPRAAVLAFSVEGAASPMRPLAP